MGRGNKEKLVETMNFFKKKPAQCDSSLADQLTQQLARKWSDDALVDGANEVLRDVTRQIVTAAQRGDNSYALRYYHKQDDIATFCTVSEESLNGYLYVKARTSIILAELENRGFSVVSSSREQGDILIKW